MYQDFYYIIYLLLYSPQYRYVGLQQWHRDQSFSAYISQWQIASTEEPAQVWVSVLGDSSALDQSHDSTALSEKSLAHQYHQQQVQEGQGLQPNSQAERRMDSLVKSILIIIQLFNE